LALFVLIVGTNLPSPLYAVWAHQFGFAPVVLALIFATYAGVLIPALLVAGSLADRFGYRPVLLVGLAVAAVGTVVFAYADAAGWLFLARALQGAAVGISSGALTAALLRTEPHGNAQKASLMASLATTAGGGLGPVLAGACAGWLPAPTRMCFLIEAGSLGVAGVGLLALPARLGRSSGARWRVSLPRLPAAHRDEFRWACATGFTGWAVTAVFLSIVPTYVRTLTGNADLLLAGVAAGLLLLVAAAVQPLGVRAGAAALQAAGMIALAVGTVLLLLAGRSGLLSLVITAAAVAGVGQGLAFMGAVRAANDAAHTGVHAAVISTFYVCAYVGVGVPVVGVGLLATVTSTTAAVDVFALVALAASLVVAAAHLRRRQRC